MRKIHIPFIDLKRQYKSIKPEIERAIQKVLRHQYFILGEEVEKFEQEFAQYLGSKYLVSVGSGTDGLILALWALGIGKKDEVILPSNTFIATAIAINRVGAAPVFVDCDPNTYQIDINKIEKRISKKTKAIIPVHLYGASCEIDSLLKIAKKHNLYVIEDASQAHGSTYRNKKLGTFGDIGVFSFYPSKNLGAYGDGGAISTHDKNLYETLMRLRNYGQSQKNYSDIIGVNSRLDEIQAAVLRVKLMYLNRWNQKRNVIAKEYIKQFGKSVRTQTIINSSVSNYHLFVIEAEYRDELQDFLKQKGIDTLIHYPIPIHLQKSFKYLNYKYGDFPIVERIAKHALSLPVFPELTQSEIQYVSTTLKKFYQ